jgi:hypothetical protein
MRLAMSAFGTKQTSKIGRRISLSEVKRTLRRPVPLSANDPKRTLAVHCGDGLDAGFSP